MDYRLQHVPEQGMHPGVTYVVSHYGTVLFTLEYTRHILLTKRAGFSRDQIAWGGILSVDGHWVRGSFDFGDAPTAADRDAVVELLQNYMK